MADMMQKIVFSAAVLWAAVLFSAERSGAGIGVSGGVAMAFSPPHHVSYLRSTSSVATEKNFLVRESERGSSRIVSYASNDINGDIITEEADKQSVSIYARSDISTPTATAFDDVVNARYACTRFQRYQEESSVRNDGINTTSSNVKSTGPSASLSDPSTVQSAHECLALSQRAPTGFNAQPYRIILVHSKKEKEKLAQYCLGRNADRVRDSDCTAVFLADRECGRDGKRFTNFLVENMDDQTSTESAGSDATISKSTAKGANTSRTRRPLSSKALFKLRVLILLFSSGYPLPRFLSIPLSFGARLAVSIFAFLARCLYKLKQSFNVLSSILPNNIQLLPTLSSAETWSQKNTMLVAMTYMLACTSCGLATCPMEGIDASGVRKVLCIPRGRYGIPLIVSTGTPYHRQEEEEEDEETDDVGLSHGISSMSPRYPLDEVVFGNAFGQPFVQA